MSDEMSSQLCHFTSHLPHAYSGVYACGQDVAGKSLPARSACGRRESEVDVRVSAQGVRVASASLGVGGVILGRRNKRINPLTLTLALAPGLPPFHTHTIPPVPLFFLRAHALLSP